MFKQVKVDSDFMYLPPLYLFFCLLRSENS